MIETYQDFQNRLSTVVRKHSKMYTLGYITKIGKDGLIIAKPKRGRFQFPIRGLAFVVFGFFAFKAFMLVSLGEITYADRIALLSKGTAFERAGAMAMQVDPITRTMGTFANSVLR